MSFYQKRLQIEIVYFWTYAWSVGVRQDAQEIENQAASNGDDAGTNALKLISFLSQSNSKNWSHTPKDLFKEKASILIIRGFI